MNTDRDICNYVRLLPFRNVFRKMYCLTEQPLVCSVFVIPWYPRHVLKLALNTPQSIQDMYTHLQCMEIRPSIGRILIIVCSRKYYQAIDTTLLNLGDYGWTIFQKVTSRSVIKTE